MATILVLTNSYDDVHVQAVQKHLNSMGHDLVRMDVDRIIRGEWQVRWDYQNVECWLITEYNAYNLFEVDSVWFRKPYGFGTSGFVESIKDPVQRAAVAKEARDLIDGLSMALGSKFWLNSLEDLNRARLKPYQLHLAKAVGMLVPESIITSDPEAARNFCAQRPTVLKPLAEPHLAYDSSSRVVETTLMTEEHIRGLDLIRSQPILLQRYIDKQCELRVTCVGEELFVARQTLTGGQFSTKVVDWRALQGTNESIYTPADLPPGIAVSIRGLLRELRLGFAAMDLAVDQRGEYYFLEVNPNGQWLGYTDEIGLPAAASVARCLGQQTRRLQ